MHTKENWLFCLPVYFSPCCIQYSNWLTRGHRRAGGKVWCLRECDELKNDHEAMPWPMHSELKSLTEKFHRPLENISSRDYEPIKQYKTRQEFYLHAGKKLNRRIYTIYVSHDMSPWRNQNNQIFIIFKKNQVIDNLILIVIYVRTWH